MAANEQDVAQVTSMGFSGAQAREALSVSNGNVEMAVNYLLMGAGGGIDPSTSMAAAAEPPAQDASIAAKADGGLLRCNISQYSVDSGRSACTCISLTAASQFLQDQTVTSEFLEQMITQGVKNYQQLSSSASSVEHLSAEEVLQKDNNQGAMFQVQSLGDGSIRQGVLSHTPDHPLGLKSVLEGLRHEEHSEWMCILITKTPETVLLCFSPDSVSPSSYWLIDSHPRPQLGIDSAYAKLHPTLDTLLLSLQAIFPCTDLGPDVPEMMAMMYNSFDLYPLIRSK